MATEKIVFWDTEHFVKNEFLRKLLFLPFCIGQCTGHFESSQFSPKSAILKDLKEKFLKWLQPRHIMYIAQIYYCAWFKSPLGQKMPWFWAKTIIFHLKNSHFGCFKGFKGQIEVPRQFLQYNIIINALQVKNQLIMHFEQSIFHNSGPTYDLLSISRV